jgi:hypothetical protein
LKLNGLLKDSSHLKVSLTAAVMVAGGIKVRIDDVKLDGQLIDLIIEVSIALDHSANQPIPCVSSSIVKKLELIGGSNEQVLELGWYWQWGDQVGLFVVFVVGLCIELEDEQVIVQPLGVGICGDCATGVELDLLGWLVEIGSDQDAKVRDVIGIDQVAQWRSVEGFLVVADLLLQIADRLAELVVYKWGVSLSLGNCWEESIGDGSQDLLVKVIIGTKGVHHCPRWHCRWCWRWRVWKRKQYWTLGQGDVRHIDGVVGWHLGVGLGRRWGAGAWGPGKLVDEAEEAW